jgi:hypothetical protein
MRNRILTAVLWIAILSIAGMALTIIAWLLLPYDVVQIKEPIKILNPNKQIAIGEPIIQELKIYKPNDQAPANASRLLVCENGRLINLAVVPNVLNLPIGEYTLTNDRYLLPSSVLPGDKCVFVWRQTYEVNPIREIPVEWRTETFTVKESK